MFPRPRSHGGNGPARYRQYDTQMIAGSLASLLDQGSMPWEWNKAHPRPPRRCPRQYPRRPYFYGYPRREGDWTRFPREAVRGIRDPTRCQGEAIRWPSVIEDGSITIPQVYNSATFSFVTILVFRSRWFSILLPQNLYFLREQSLFLPPGNGFPNNS